MSSPPMTVANQQEMQRQLKALADRHKKAKLQELFSRQDELRPFTNLENSKSDNENENRETKEEFQAMKSQFYDLQKEQLTKQITKQFDLRLTEKNVNNEYGEKAQINFYGYGSDGSGDQKIEDQDVEAMKAEFDKYQKLLLNTQIEKSFRLRLPKENKNKNIIKSLSDDDDQEHDDDEEDDDDKKEKERIKSIKQDSENMQTKYAEMNKMMLRYRSRKMLQTTIEPEIKPQHRESFEILMKDIGILNQSIMDKLWKNIENTVHQNTPRDDHDDDYYEQIDHDDDQDKDILIDKLKNENEILLSQIKYMQQQLSQQQNDNDNDNDIDIDDEQVDAFDDGEMLIIN